MKLNSHLDLLGKAQRYFADIKSNDQKLELRALLQSNLKAFYRYFWPYMSAVTYVDNWHIDALCDHLMAAARGEIKRLGITIPPRHSKTGICTIDFTPWVWASDPSKKFIYGSQDLKLATDFSRQCRDLMLTAAYQDLFQVRLKKDAMNKQLFVNTRFGHRLTVSVNSSITGMGGDFIIGDDVNDVNKVQSEAHRADAMRWLTNSAVTRVESQHTVLINVQQRVHQWDGTGCLLSLEDPDFVLLSLPMEFDEKRRCTTYFAGKSWTDPRTTQGELLWPERFDGDFVKRLKRSMSEMDYATQYQQLPSPESGVIFKKEDWHYYKASKRPQLLFILQSWDTGLTVSETACFSACTTWGIFEDDHGVRKTILLNLWKEKVEYPDLRHIAQRMYMNYRDTVVNHKSPIPEHPMRANQVVVEEKVSGFSLLSDFRRAGINAVGFNPGKYGKKVLRARFAAALIQGGAVVLPCRDYDDRLSPMPHAEKLIMECAMYTGEDGSGNDVVDSMSQALIYMNEHGWIYNQNDPDVPRNMLLSKPTFTHHKY